jgi:RNA polymerase sigma factor (sigma-70 family)
MSRQDLQIASLRPWIRTLAERWRRRYAHRLSVDLDDLCQAGALGALKASTKWDPTQASWITYATLWIDEYMRQEIEHSLLQGAEKRSHYRRTRELPVVHFDGSSRISSDRGITLVDKLNEQRIWLQRLMTRAGLNERELTILERCDLLDETLESVGEELGLSRQRVHQVRERALEKLREVVL